MRPYLPYLTTAVKAATRVKYVLWIGEKQGLGNGCVKAKLKCRISCKTKVSYFTQN